jgi:hypothetical protein
MLRELLTQKSVDQKNVTDFRYPRGPEHVDSENINLKIRYGSYLYQLFSKRDLKGMATIDLGYSTLDS